MKPSDIRQGRVLHFLTILRITTFGWITIFGISIFPVQTAECALADAKRLTAFIHASLIPMTSEMVLQDQTVIVEDGRISRVGPSNETQIPPKARVIDCRKAFLMPGLADMHMHLRYNWLGGAWPVSPLKLYLANGVTTVRCFGPRGKTGRYGLTWRKQIAAGRMDGPYILTCGPMLRGHFKKDPEDLVIIQKYREFDFLKVYSFVTPAQFKIIMKTADRLDFYVAGHIPFQVGLDGVLAQGMDEVAHIEEFLWEFADLDRRQFFESEGEWMAYAIGAAFQRFEPYFKLNSRERDKRLDALTASVLKKLDGRQIPVCTTLVVDDVIQQKLFAPKQFLDKPEIRYLPAAYLKRLREGQDKHQRQFKGGEKFAPFKYALDKKLLKALKKAGAPLLLSTDAGTGWMGIVPGFSVHDELDILVKNGFSPYEAISTGTVAASKIVERMNGQDDFGTIAPGKRADLILVAQNPLQDVANIRNILGVMAAGRWYETERLSGWLDN